MRETTVPALGVVALLILAGGAAGQEPGPPGSDYEGDAFELRKIRDDFDWVVPGHGDAFQDRERIAHLQVYLRDLWDQVSDAQRRGVPAEEAARRIDRTSHAEGLPCIAGPGVNDHAVLRIYELLESEGR
jgi:glyoxylase-like metal-dependent hydrolase (beta-lactamase superfamily II)